MRQPATSTTNGAAVFRRLVLTSLLGAGLAMAAMPGVASAADPSASPSTHELLERELVPVMADDAAFDLVDLAALEVSPA